MTGVAKSVARLCVGQRRAQFRDVTPSSPAATASFSGLHAATSCQKGTNTNTASLPARCAGHTPNPPRQMRWRWRKLISTIPQKKIYYNTSKSYIGFVFYKEYVGRWTDDLLKYIRHVESEAWGGIRRVGRRYLSCSALAAMAFRCAAAKPRNWMCATPPAAAAKPRHWMCAAPPARTPSIFFRSDARNIYIQLSRRPRFFSLSRSWRPIFVSRRQRGALDPK